MTGVCETAYAKLNLALHVRRREADGYHAIETIFAFCEDGDTLELSEAPGLRVSGPFGQALAGSDNLVLRAAEGFAKVFGGPVAGFRLDKRLPVAAGIGGGSADAAAALRLLCGRHGIDIADARISRLAASLGADVPACLESLPARGTGRGDVLEPAPGPGAKLVLLVNPLAPLATGEVFAACDGQDRGALGDPMTGRNDLEAPAIVLRPVIGDVLALLRQQPGATLVRMSGSGATCFALFDDQGARDRAQAAVVAAEPGWWRMATKLR